MFVLRDIVRIKLPCGLLYLGLAPAVSAFGQDGQIILGVFIPVIVLVIILIVARVCWEWKGMGRHDECDDIDQLDIVPRPVLCVQAPTSSGKVIHEVTKQNQLRRTFQTLLEDDSFGRLPFSSTVKSRTFRQRMATRKSSRYKLTLRRRHLHPNGDVGNNISSEHDNKQRNFSRNDHFRVQRQLSRSSSIKSLDMELWLESRIRTRNRAGQREVKRIRHRKIMKRNLTTGNMSNSTNDGMRRLSIRNNLGKSGYENGRNSSLATSWKRSKSYRHTLSSTPPENDCSRVDKIQTRRRKHRNNCHARQSFPNSTHRPTIGQSTDWSSHLQFTSNINSRKPCLKINKICRKPSKHVRFEVKQVRYKKPRALAQRSRKYPRNIHVRSSDRSIVDQRNVWRVEHRMNFEKALIDIGSVYKTEPNIKEKNINQSNLRLGRLEKSPFKHKVLIHSTDGKRSRDQSYFPILNIIPQYDNVPFCDVSRNHVKLRNNVSPEIHKATYTESEEMLSMKSYEQDNSKMCSQLVNNKNLFPFPDVDRRHCNQATDKSLGFTSGSNHDIHHPTEVRVFCTDQSSSFLTGNAFGFSDEMSYNRPS